MTGIQKLLPSLLWCNKSLPTIWCHWLFWPQKLLPWLQTSKRDSSDRWFIWYGLPETTCEESVQDMGNTTKV